MMFAITPLSILIIIFISLSTVGASSTSIQSTDGTNLTNNCKNTAPCSRCFHLWRPIVKGLKDSSVDLIVRAHNLSQYLTSSLEFESVSEQIHESLRLKRFSGGKRISFDDLDEKIRIIGDYLLANKQTQDRSNLLKHELSSVAVYINQSLEDSDRVVSSLAELTAMALRLISLAEMQVRPADVGGESHLDRLQLMIADLNYKISLLAQQTTTLDANTLNEFVALLHELTLERADSTCQITNEDGLLKRAILITGYVERGVEHYLADVPVAQADLMETGRLINLADEAIMKAEVDLEALESRARTIMQTIDFEATGDFPRLMFNNQVKALSRNSDRMESSWRRARDEMLYLSSTTSSSNAGQVFNECKRILDANLPALEPELSDGNNKTTTTVDQEITQSHLDTVLSLRQQVEVVEDRLGLMVNNRILEANIEMGYQTDSLLTKIRAINAESEKSIKAIKEQAVAFEQNLDMIEQAKQSRLTV